MNAKDRTWAEIHLERIDHNYKLLRNAAPTSRLLASVKADGYGHGAVAVARRLAGLGCDYLSVACLAEAVELRRAGINLPILVYGYTNPADATLLTELNLTQSIFTLEMAQAYSAALAGTDAVLNIHIKLDSGMGRLGFDCRLDEPLDAPAVPGLPHLNVEGIFTHFAVADSDTEKDDAYTLQQLAHFTRAADWLDTASGRKIPMRHTANSAAAWRLPQTHLDMIRPGLAVYGLAPNPAAITAPLQPVMELKTRIIQVRTFADAAYISYGKSYRTTPGETLATVPIGYADGLPRHISGKMDMLLHGQRVPQVGRICMDMCMLDVSAVPNAKAGDVITVFGTDGDVHLSIDTHAAAADTIAYELLCRVAPRVPRVYVGIDSSRL